MSRYTKIRELVTLARRLEGEGRRLAKGSQGRIDRMCEAEGYRVKAAWLAGRITDEQYADAQVEQLDARTFAAE